MYIISALVLRGVFSYLTRMEHYAHPTSETSSLMVSMLTIVLKVRRFKPGRRYGFVRAIKLCNRPFFGEVKLEAPCRKFLWHVKITCK
jgi:hypothetical protein